MREGKAIKGRAGGDPIQPAQPVGAQNAAPAPMQAAPAPIVPVEAIPVEVRQSLAQAGMPVEQMNNELR